jgi:RNA polymerase sigma factor (sigma-70 family)
VKPGEEFEQLMRQYARVVSNAVRRACGNTYRRLIPDAEQEVYLTLWRVVEDGKKMEKPASYLYKVALRAALGLIRKHAPESLVEEEWLEAEADRRAASRPSDSADLAERARRLDELLHELPGEQSQALRAYLAGYNHTEVAELFGLTESVARHRIYRGIQALKDRAKRNTA